MNNILKAAVALFLYSSAENILITTKNALDQDEVKALWENISKKNDPQENINFLSEYAINVSGDKEKLDFFKNILNSLDKKPKQIKIQLTSLQNNINYNLGYGMDISGIYNRLASLKTTNNFTFIGVGGREGDIPTPSVPFDPNNANLFVSPNNFSLNLFTGNILNALPQNVLINEEARLKVPIVFGGPDLNTKRLNFLLNAFEQEQKIKDVSKSELLLKDSYTTKIIAGKSLPIYIKIIEPILEAVTTESVLTYQNIGVSVEARGKILGNKIFLKLKINSTFTLGGNTFGSEDGLLINPPVLEAYKSEVNIVLKNGESRAVFIGSLEDIYNAYNNLPGASKIPVLGKLFSARGAYDTKIENFLILSAEIIE